jgi:hypothetical protein
MFKLGKHVIQILSRIDERIDERKSKRKSKRISKAAHTLLLKLVHFKSRTQYTFKWGQFQKVF